MLTDLKPFLAKIKLPDAKSHKGQNGKLMVIGGSELFHVASRWSLDVASKFVDMVFYSSVPINNELIKEAKGAFWNGIVVDRADVESYLDEADCILIGPGMTRTSETKELIDDVLSRYPDKKWVIDAGALQMVKPSLLNQNCIITPHKQEFAMIYKKRVMEFAKVLPDGSVEGEYAGESFGTASNWKESYPIWFEDAMIHGMEIYDQLSQVEMDDFLSYLKHTSRLLGKATVLVKGPLDFIVRWDQDYHHSPVEVIEGGNAGMTKGGTGDVLAGIVAGLYCTNDALTSAVVGSFLNKKAGDSLYQKVGPNFNASDLVDEVPRVLWAVIKGMK